MLNQDHTYWRVEIWIEALIVVAMSQATAQNRYADIAHPQ